MPKQSSVTYVNTGFTLNVILYVMTILTTNTFKVQIILRFVLPVAVLSSHLHFQITVAPYQPSPVIDLTQKMKSR